MDKLRKLDAYELAEIIAYAGIEGRRWKDTLQTTSWWRGIPARDKHGKEYPSLYGLRNSHGPSWLTAFRLPTNL